jgi:hypothetical protein
MKAQETMEEMEDSSKPSNKKNQDWFFGVRHFS